MASFLIKIQDNLSIRFRLYEDAAPVTAAAFEKTIPFSRTFLHARISGEEIWTDDGPQLDILQENVSVFAEPGEIVVGPIKPVRNKVANCIGIFYGKGQLLDGANIFGKVFDEDMFLLEALGEIIWREGEQLLSFEMIR
jgi:hypothetical protein